MASELNSIKCYLPNYTSNKLELMGYEDFTSTILCSITIDKKGRGVLTYPKSYKGAANLLINGESRLLLMLNNESFKIESLNDDFKILESQENEVYTKGMETYLLSISKMELLYNLILLNISFLMFLKI